MTLEETILAEQIEEARELIFVKQTAGAEDLMFGFGSVSQVREGENVTLNLINADTIPYTDTLSVKEALDEIRTILAINSLTAGT
jgi:hypothetical protein